MKLLTVAGILLLLTGAAFSGWLYELNPSDFTSNATVLFVPWLIFGIFGAGIASFALSRVYLKPVQARAIAVVFIIFAASVPGLVYYSEQTSLIGCLGCSMNESLLPFVVTGTLIAQPGSGNGILNVQLKNTGLPNSLIIGITFTNECPNDCPGTNGTITNVDTIALMYEGSPVSPQNPLPVGTMATGEISVQGVTVGEQYNMNVVATFHGASQVVQTMELTAQS